MNISLQSFGLYQATRHFTRGLPGPQHSGFDMRGSPSAHNSPQFKWMSHGLRKGAASAAACIGAPLIKTRCVGGWSNTNDVATGKYIDPTTSGAPVAWPFFEWLVAAPPV
jgi:hypothetical protein